MKLLSHILRVVPRYTLAAITLAGLHNAILIGADALGVHYVVAQLMSAAVLLPVGFLTMTKFSYSVEGSWSGFWRYACALITNFPVAIFSLWLLLDVLALPMWAGAPVSTLFLYVWNFLATTWAFMPSGAAWKGAGHG